MGGRSANAAAIVVAVLGLIGYVLFEGLVSGLALLWPASFWWPWASGPSRTGASRSGRLPEGSA